MPKTWLGCVHGVRAYGAAVQRQRCKGAESRRGRAEVQRGGGEGVNGGAERAGEGAEGAQRACLEARNALTMSCNPAKLLPILKTRKTRTCRRGAGGVQEEWVQVRMGA